MLQWFIHTCYSQSATSGASTAVDQPTTNSNIELAERGIPVIPALWGLSPEDEEVKGCQLHNTILLHNHPFPFGLGKYCLTIEHIQMLPGTVNRYQFSYRLYCIKCCKSQEARIKIRQECLQGLSANSMYCSLGDLSSPRVWCLKGPWSLSP